MRIYVIIFFYYYFFHSNEEVFLLACEACLAMNIHYSDRKTNQFMKALMEAEENQHFGEALTWILNKQSAPYSNGPLLKQSLKSLQDLFSGQFFFFFSFGMWNVEIFF